MAFLNQELLFFLPSLLRASQTKAQSTISLSLLSSVPSNRDVCSEFPQKAAGIEMRLWICISEVPRELLLAHNSMHIQFPSLIQAHKMRLEGRGEEGRSHKATRPHPPPPCFYDLGHCSKLFQFCEASEQAEGKEEHFS